MPVSSLLSFPCLLIPIQPQKPLSVFQAHTAGPDPETLFCYSPSSFKLGGLLKSHILRVASWAPISKITAFFILLLYFFRIVLPTTQFNKLYIYISVYIPIKYKHFFIFLLWKVLYCTHVTFFYLTTYFGVHAMTV